MSQFEKKVKISEDGKHVNELVWETIVVKNGQPFHQIWLFEQNRFPCGRCRSIDVKFMSLPTGAYKTCPKCGFTEGVATTNIDTGEAYAELIQEKPVTVNEAWAILRKHNSHPYAPLNLPLPSDERKRKVIIE